MKVEQGETGGEQCLRHLRSISAWAAAVFYLFSDTKESRLLRSQELFRHAGLVEVTTELTRIHSIVDVGSLRCLSSTPWLEYYSVRHSKCI